MHYHWDEILEQEMREELRDMGLDEESIECAIQEAREGHSVTVVAQNQPAQPKKRGQGKRKG